jgi:hypothetical protein
MYISVIILTIALSVFIGPVAIFIGIALMIIVFFMTRSNKNINAQIDGIAETYEQILQQRFPNIQCKRKYDVNDKNSPPAPENFTIKLIGIKNSQYDKAIDYLQESFASTLEENNIPKLPLDLRGDIISL